MRISDLAKSIRISASELNAFIALNEFYSIDLNIDSILNQNTKTNPSVLDQHSSAYELDRLIGSVN